MSRLPRRTRRLLEVCDRYNRLVGDLSAQSEISDKRIHQRVVVPISHPPITRG